MSHVFITGGAGYIGSLLTGLVLLRGYQVTVVDDLIFGGDSLLGYWHHPRFRFVKGDVCDPEVLRKSLASLTTATAGHGAAGNRRSAVVHLAAIVGFPACQTAERQAAWRCNVEATERVFEIAEAAGVNQFIFASTYSNYGVAENGSPVTEDSPLYPQSLYAETKIAAEQYLLSRARAARCAPQIYRFATLFGISPRTRFDLIINQFVLDALTNRELVIYQHRHARSFVHVRDACEAICLALEAPLDAVRGQVFNVGSEGGNYTKDEIGALVQRHVPGTRVRYSDMQPGGDIRDITVSFAKIRRLLGFEPSIGIEQGIVEVRDAMQQGVIRAPLQPHYYNATLSAH
jgi:nucleoside-diphosphate-sugar epimerase